MALDLCLALVCFIQCIPTILITSLKDWRQRFRPLLAFLITVAWCLPVCWLSWYLFGVPTTVGATFVTLIYLLFTLAF